MVSGKQRGSRGVGAVSEQCRGWCRVLVSERSRSDVGQFRGSLTVGLTVPIAVACVDQCRSVGNVGCRIFGWCRAVSGCRGVGMSGCRV